MKIVFLTRSLMPGGAERQLVSLACGLSDRDHEVSIVTLYGGGPFSEQLGAHRVEVVDMGKRGRWDAGSLVRVIATVRRIGPDVLYSFVAAQNVLAAIIRCFVRRTILVWGIRASDLDLTGYDRLARLLYGMERVLSFAPALVICNSSAGREFVLSLGYPGRKTHLVSNGIDTDRFRYSEGARARLRADWGIGTTEVLIGMVARLDPAKDHPGFLAAANQLAALREDVKFICVGKGVELLQEREDARLLGKRLICKSSRDDMPAVYSAMDLLCSSSVSEGFSNAIAEAMACERKCVVTDVGDSARIVGKCGMAVSAGDTGALARALETVIESGALDRDARARSRIERCFSLQRMVESTERLLVSVAGGPA